MSVGQGQNLTPPTVPRAGSRNLPRGIRGPPRKAEVGCRLTVRTETVIKRPQENILPTIIFCLFYFVQLVVVIFIVFLLFKIF